MDFEPTGDLVRRLIADIAALVRIYNSEIRTYVQSLGRDVVVAAIMFAAALALGLFALGVAVAVLILVADIWLPAWAAALLVLVLMAGAAVALAMLGIRRLRGRQTQWSERVAEEIRWLRSLFPGRS